MKRSTEGLRDMLFNELDLFLDGKVDSDHVKSVTRITGSILATVAKDLEAKRLLMDMNYGKDQPRAIADIGLNLMLTSSNNAP